MTEKYVTISETCGVKFAKTLNELASDGYRVIASDCGFVDSESYEFCESWQAIMEKTND
jgi:hypothetical protein